MLSVVNKQLHIECAVAKSCTHEQHKDICIHRDDARAHVDFFYRCATLCSSLALARPIKIHVKEIVDFVVGFSKNYKKRISGALQ